MALLWPFLSPSVALFDPFVALLCSFLDPFKYLLVTLFCRLFGALFGPFWSFCGPFPIWWPLWPFCGLLKLSVALLGPFLGPFGAFSRPLLVALSVAFCGLVAHFGDPCGHFVPFGGPLWHFSAHFSALFYVFFCALS